MKLSQQFAALALCTCAAGAACRAEAGAPDQDAKPRPEKQNLDALRQLAEQFLQTQSATLPGQVNISVGNVDARLNLPACSSPQAFLPQGSRVWGKTTVGIRCSAPSPWTMFVQATIKVTSEYVAAAVPLAAGQVIQPGQLMLLQGDLTSLPPGVLTDMQLAVGRASAMAVQAGAPLRQDGLRNQNIISQGQLVKLISSGPGFRVSSEARAINNASDGQPVQVKTAGGQQISGIAQAGGIVQVNY